jgi:inorganic pyrophosphatase
MDIGAISVGPDPPKDIYAVIEIPLGGAPVKYELDKASGALMVDRFLKKSSQCRSTRLPPSTRTFATTEICRR